MNTRRSFLRSLFGGAAVAAVAPLAVAELVARPRPRETPYFPRAPAMQSWRTVHGEKPDPDAVREWQRVMDDLRSRHVFIDHTSSNAQVARFSAEFRKNNRAHWERVKKTMKRLKKVKSVRVNPHINRRAYLRQLSKLKPDIRKQLLEGEWVV